MRNASGHQCKMKMRGSEKIKIDRKHVRHFLHKKSLGKFHALVVQNNGKEMYQKLCCTCKVAFLLIRPIVVFSPISGVAFAA